MPNEPVGMDASTGELLVGWDYVLQDISRALTTAYFERVKRELDLTPEQSVQMQSVLNDMWQYYKIVMTDSKARVDQLLTPDQRRKFERLLQEHQPR